MQRVKHKIRNNYGFTDEQILDHIQQYGQEWAVESYEFIMEDENTFWQLLTSVAPIARSPMSKKAGKELLRYTKTIRKEIAKALAPWLEERRIQAVRERLAKPPESKVYDEHGKEIDLNDPDWWKREV